MLNRHPISLTDFFQELAKFAKDRGVSVSSLSNPPRKLLLKRDYYAAFKTADAKPSFAAFMDLSPELRTRVYQEVLILQDSFTCYPQILATSKQVNQEASNILYGDNVIDVHLLADGVYVHGEKISESESRLSWPTWIRRVQFLRFSLKHHLTINVLRAYTLFGVSQGSLFLVADVDRVLHSLCSFLGSDHRLRSFHVSITGTSDLKLLQFAPHMLHSTKLLGELKELEFHGEIANLGPVPQDIWSVEDAMANAYLTKISLLEHAEAAFGRAFTVNAHTAADPRDPVKDFPPDINQRRKREEMAIVMEQARVSAMRFVFFFLENPLHGLRIDNYDQVKSYLAAITRFLEAHMDLEAADHQSARNELQAGAAIAS
jgi:hypothetical protein